MSITYSLDLLLKHERRLKEICLIVSRLLSKSFLQFRIERDPNLGQLFRKHFRVRFVLPFLLKTFELFSIYLFSLQIGLNKSFKNPA